MTHKQQNQAHAEMIKLKNIPRNMDVASNYIDVLLMNFNFETMTAEEHKETIALLSDMLSKFRMIRGR